MKKYFFCFMVILIVIMAINSVNAVEIGQNDEISSDCDVQIEASKVYDTSYKNPIEIKNNEVIFNTEGKYYNSYSYNTGQDEYYYQLYPYAYSYIPSETGDASNNINLTEYPTGKYSITLYHQYRASVMDNSENQRIAYVNIYLKNNLFDDPHQKVVKSDTVITQDITKMYKNGTAYSAKFIDEQGNPLSFTPVSLKINGVSYSRTTDNNGIAKMNINLDPGKYIITATNPVTQEKTSSTINVLPIIVENKDLTKYYKNASAFVVKLLDDAGNPVGANEEITYNINGVFYKRYTDTSGHVKLNINLNPGSYIITGEYKGCKVSNTIVVLSTLKANDMSMSYKDGSKFEVLLMDGKGNPYVNQNVVFNINGVFYTRITDNSGIARLNINLLPGDYIITSMYNGLCISNTIHINPTSSSTNNDEIIYINVGPLDQWTTKQVGIFTIKVMQWETPYIGELDVQIFNPSGYLIDCNAYLSQYTDGIHGWSNWASTPDVSTYHKYHFATGTRLTQVAVKLNGLRWDETPGLR